MEPWKGLPAIIIIAESFANYRQLVMCTLQYDRRRRFLQYNFMDPGWGSRISYGGQGSSPPPAGASAVQAPHSHCQLIFIITPKQQRCSHLLVHWQPVTSQQSCFLAMTERVFGSKRAGCVGNFVVAIRHFRSRLRS